MKKTVSVACALVLVLGLWVGGALAYNFNDTTQVQPWQGNSATGGAWTDVIGLTSLFDTFGADLSGNTFTISTNWNPNKDGSVNAAVLTADLFIDNGCDGTWDVAIQLDTLTGTGKVYANPAYNTSFDIFSSLSGLTYGGRYDEASPQAAPVQTTSGDTGTTSVVWTIGADPDQLNNQVAIDLSGLGLGSQWGFFWGTATCANDGFAACVPVPPSVLLLGSGILGVGLLRWRRRGSEALV
jgi:hypothetical protein